MIYPHTKHTVNNVIEIIVSTKLSKYKGMDFERNILTGICTVFHLKLCQYHDWFYLARWQFKFITLTSGCGNNLLAKSLASSLVLNFVFLIICQTVVLFESTLVETATSDIPIIWAAIPSRDWIWIVDKFGMIPTYLPFLNSYNKQVKVLLTLMHYEK